MIGSSFSSLTRTEQAPEFMRAETKMSLDRTSSFFWSSPLEFWSPAIPNRLAMPALAHARDVALHARPSCAIRMVSCDASPHAEAAVRKRLKRASFASRGLWRGVAGAPPCPWCCS